MSSKEGIDISVEQVITTQAIKCWKITIKGYLDASTSEKLKAETLSLTLKQSVKVILDLKEVTFIDGEG